MILKEIQQSLLMRNFSWELRWSNSYLPLNSNIVRKLLRLLLVLLIKDRILVHLLPWFILISIILHIHWNNWSLLWLLICKILIHLLIYKVINYFIFNHFNFLILIDWNFIVLFFNDLLLCEMIFFAVIILDFP